MTLLIERVGYQNIFVIAVRTHSFPDYLRFISAKHCYWSFWTYVVSFLMALFVMTSGTFILGGIHNVGLILLSIFNQAMRVIPYT